MKKGDIIRRISQGSKTEYGPLMRIVSTEKHYVWATTIGPFFKFKNGLCMGDKGDIQSCVKKFVVQKTTTTLFISEDLLMKLKHGIKSIVTHPATSRWMSAYDKKIQLVRFKSHPKEYEGMFTVEEIVLTKSMGEAIVRITVGEIIYL